MSFYCAFCEEFISMESQDAILLDHVRDTEQLHFSEIDLDQRQINKIICEISGKKSPPTNLLVCARSGQDLYS